MTNHPVATQMYYFILQRFHPVRNCLVRVPVQWQPNCSYIALREAMAVKSKRICQFFHATYESDADSPIPNNSVVATTMKLVMDHFKENSDSIFVLADVSTTSLL